MRRTCSLDGRQPGKPGDTVLHMNDDVALREARNL